MLASKNHGNEKPNIPAAIRDVVNNSINKGQLPLVGIIAILLLAIWKTPPEYMPTLWNGFFSALAKWWAWGYVIALVEGLVIVYGGRYLRRCAS